MQTDPQTPPTSKAMLWSGRVISAIPVLMLLMSGGMKLARPPFVIEQFTTLGYPENVALGIGVVEVALIYAIPQTAMLGAILMTGYLGGATATHVRVSEPFLIPIGLGVIAWLG